MAGAFRKASEDGLPPEIRGQFLDALADNPHGWGPRAEGFAEQPYTGPYADTYEPGWRDMVADGLRSAIGESDKMMSPEGYRMVTGIAGATGAGGGGSSVADFVPGLGLATASMDSAQALHSGNYPIATLSALSALVPGAIGKVIKNAGRGALHAITDPIRELVGHPRPGSTLTGPVQARAVHGSPYGQAGDPDFDYKAIHPNLTPVDFDFKNALIVNKGGGRHEYYDLPYDLHTINPELPWAGKGRDDTDSLAKWARTMGHDGLVVHNVRDPAGYGVSAPYATTYAALKPGTVKSALTGDQVFDLAPAAAFGAGTATAGRGAFRKKEDAK